MFDCNMAKEYFPSNLIDSTGTNSGEEGRSCLGLEWCGRRAYTGLNSAQLCDHN